MLILATGATGKVGRKLVACLPSRGGRNRSRKTCLFCVECKGAEDEPRIYHPC